MEQVFSSSDSVVVISIIVDTGELTGDASPVSNVVSVLQLPMHSS